MRGIWALVFLPFFAWGEVYFDCIVIGTSPIPMVEAIYQHYSGKSVLVLEQGAECGGAWKSISACGTEHVDMGCHELIGADARVRDFLRTYLGCKIVSMESPLDECIGCSRFYFARGCYELIGNLEKIIARTGVELMLNQPVEWVAAQPDRVIVRAGGMDFSTRKVVTSPNSFFQVEGLVRPLPSPFRFWHLYLLLQDPSPPRFSYTNYSLSGISRCMNLTHFAGLFGSGRQLLVFQAYQEEILRQAEKILADLKQKQLVDPSAYIIQSETYVYEQFPYNTEWLRQLPEAARNYFEILDTSAFGSMSRYLPRWEQVLKPYEEMVH